jgi:hypothetical protein
MDVGSAACHARDQVADETEPMVVTWPAITIAFPAAPKKSI